MKKSIAVLLSVFAMTTFAAEDPAWGLTSITVEQNGAPFAYVSGTLATGTMNDVEGPIGLRAICTNNDSLLGLRLPVVIDEEQVTGTISIDGKVHDKAHEWYVAEYMVYNRLDKVDKLIKAMKRGNSITTSFTHGSGDTATWTVTHSLAGFTEQYGQFEKRCSTLK